ncbi:MAG: sigma-70 family RNA polymerase sigma factor [Phycisphaerales bacterium]|jgi:RNA polymerase sigma-70 factor (ECF subfamily)
MVEDRLLIWKFKRGSRQALQSIYEKYRCYLLTIATALLNDVNSAEDVVHESFLAFARSGDRLRLDGSLKCYLVTCVSNRARDHLRAGRRRAVSLDDTLSICSQARGPESAAIRNEEMQQVGKALEQIPYEQREVVVLRARGQMKFKAIAELQQVSIKTVQGRYRYGLDKLRILLNGQVQK